MRQTINKETCDESVDIDATAGHSNHIRHKDFIKHLSKKALKAKGDPKFKVKRFERPINSNPSDAEGITTLNRAETKFITPELNLHPEAAAFLFHLEGCAKNLLFYLVLYELNNQTGHYPFNAQIVSRFKTYAGDLFKNEYTEDTIQQAHRKLEQKNVTANISKGKYFLNPLVAGGKSEAARRSLISEYSRLLNSKPQKDAFTDLYPIYNPR
jgi:hypothetical protein